MCSLAYAEVDARFERLQHIFVPNGFVDSAGHGDHEGGAVHLVQAAVRGSHLNEFFKSGVAGAVAIFDGEQDGGRVDDFAMVGVPEASRGVWPGVVKSASEPGFVGGVAVGGHFSGGFQLGDEGVVIEDVVGDRDIAAGGGFDIRSRPCRGGPG